MKVSKILSFFEKIAPSKLQESYDNSGLLIGRYDNEVNRALICVDVTEEVLDEAIQKDADLIISHHPVIFGGIKRLNGNNYVERIVEKAILNKLNLYAIHTNLDNVIDGTNSVLANKLSLKNVKSLSSKADSLSKLVVFCPKNHAEKVRNAMFDAGAGKIGDYDSCSYNLEGEGSFKAGDNTNPFVGNKGEIHFEKEIRIETIIPYYLENKVVNAMINAHPYEEVAYDIYPLKNKFDKIGSGIIGDLEEGKDELEFLLRLKKITQSETIRHTEIRGKKINKVAVCGGSGAFLINNAKSKGADIFITGDIKYHEFFDADGQMIIADVGHYESEQFTKDILYNLITENFSKFAVLKSEINTNPIKYL